MTNQEEDELSKIVDDSTNSQIIERTKDGDFVLSNQEILAKAIQKAIGNGWKPVVSSYPLISFDGSKVPDSQHLSFLATESIIFNHDFARAIWPWEEESKCPYCGISFPGSLMHPNPCPLADGFYPRLWQYHLQQMVIADDPIKYLGEHLA